MMRHWTARGCRQQCRLCLVLREGLSQCRWSSGAAAVVVSRLDAGVACLARRLGSRVLLRGH